MADPLSITAGIIAVIGAVEGVKKTLSKLRDFRNASSDVLSLINETSDLRIVCADVECCIQHAGQPLSQLRNMSLLLSNAKDCLAELDQLISRRILRAGAAPSELRVSRRNWAKTKPLIERFRQSLRDIRLNIVAELAVMNTSHQTRIGLTIDEIFVSQLRTGETTNHQLEAQSRLLSSILSNQSEMQSLLRLTAGSEQQRPTTVPTLIESDSLSPSTTLIGIRGHHSANQPCPSSCRCECHCVHHFQSPSLLHGVLGTLFFGYSGCPVAGLRPCTEETCLAQAPFRAYVHYLFPAWFVLKTVTITLLSIFRAEIGISLTISGVVRTGGEVMRAIQYDDIGSLRQLFNKGLASPNDRLFDGATIVYVAVRERHYKACRFLLKAGADRHLDDCMGKRTAFDCAWDRIFESPKDQSETALLREMFPDDGDCLDERQFSTLHQIILGINGRDLETELACQTDVDAVDSSGKTALMWATWRGDAKATSLLLPATARSNVVDADGISAVHYAAMSRDTTSIKLLLAAGANPNKLTARGISPLMYAAWEKDERTVIECLTSAGADPNHRAEGGRHALLVAAYHDHAIAVTALLDCGADINARDEEGDVALHQAVFSHADNTLNVLLQRGAAYASNDSMGSSILHIAANSGGLRTLNILLAAQLEGIDPETRNRQGKTAMELVRERKETADAYISKFQELCDGIKTRNAQRKRGGAQEDTDHRKSAAVKDESSQRSRKRDHDSMSESLLQQLKSPLSKRLRPAWFTKRTNLTASASRRIPEPTARHDSHQPAWVSIHLTWTVGMACTFVAVMMLVALLKLDCRSCVAPVSHLQGLVGNWELWTSSVVWLEMKRGERIHV